MKDNNNNELLLLSLSKFYSSNLDKLQEILPIIGKSSKISLRLIDWFVTNYCKKNNVVLVKKNNNNDEYFNVYSNYRSQLKAFKKIQFDPFRRRDRIDFYYSSEEFVETTIGQLNFFRWFLENDLLNYVKKNSKPIENDMIVCNSDNHYKQSKDPEVDCKNYETIHNNEHIRSTDDFQIKNQTLLNNKPRSMIKQMTKFNGFTTISFT
jgi:hypothetical protein